uniref:Uncharacterized protein n=1 Tax=Aegilops tauschii subsp. strangulata TaxID=200361 RepID=A0A453L3P9_AEGTS
MMTPIIAQHISQEIEHGKQPRINLKGYLVGNPFTGSDYDRNFRAQYAHGVGIISDQLYEAAVGNCKGNYIRPRNKLCDMSLNTIEDLISEIDEGYIVGIKCVWDLLRHRFMLEENAQLSELSPEQPTINCFAYRYYLSNIWANDNSTRDALGVKHVTNHMTYFHLC